MLRRAILVCTLVLAPATTWASPPGITPPGLSPPGLHVSDEQVPSGADRWRGVAMSVGVGLGGPLLGIHGELELGATDNVAFAAQLAMAGDGPRPGFLLRLRTVQGRFGLGLAGGGSVGDHRPMIVLGDANLYQDVVWVRSEVYAEARDLYGMLLRAQLGWGTVASSGRCIDGGDDLFDDVCENSLEIPDSGPYASASLGWRF